MQSDTEKGNLIPLVSIIVIGHNHQKHIVQTLDSIVNQNYRNIQLIIINNLPDETQLLVEDWIKRHEFINRPVFIQNDTSQSLCQNLNLGLRYVEGSFFQGLSADDILAPDKISSQVELFQSLDLSYAAVYSDMIFIDEEGRSLGKKNFDHFENVDEVKNNPVKFLLRGGKVIPAPTLLLRTDVIRNSGGYPQDWLIEDWPLYLKLAKEGYQFKILDKPLVFYRVLPESMGKVYSCERILFCLSLFEKNLWNFNASDQHQASKWFSFICQLSRFEKRLSFRKFFFFLKHNRRKLFFSAKFCLFLIKNS